VVIQGGEGSREVRSGGLGFLGIVQVDFTFVGGNSFGI